MPVGKGKQKENQEKPQKSGGKLKLLVFLLLAIILGGGLAYGALQILNPPEGTEAASPHREAEKLDLGDKVVNLGNGESGRYLRVRVVLEYPAEKKLAEEVKSKQPLLTEKVLNVFRTKRAEEILPVENQGKLKEEILKTINENLQFGKVTEVYFIDFLVQ